MARYDFDIGVIGAGAAGLTVAAGAARLGAKTLMVEKDEALGGDCLHFGCVPSKTLIHTARVYHHARRFPEFGLPPFSLPAVDFSAVAARIRSVIAAIQKHDSVDRFCSLGVKVAFGNPRFLDEHEIECDGRTFSARRWVIATGSSPAIPSIEGLAATPHLTNREIFSLDVLPASLLILGGGPIAVEMAQAFQRLGSRVTLVQRSPHILSREDPDMADTVEARLTEEGVRFILGVQTVKVADAAGAREVTVRHGDGREQVLRADALLVALGRAANVYGLDLEKAGVVFEEKGIRVDARMRTSQSHIFAAGDVTGAYQFTHAAGYEGGIVVANAVFHLPRKADYTWLPWCTYVDPELASIGLNETAARDAGHEVSVWKEPFAMNDRSLAEGERVGMIKLVLDSREKPLGVQILGPHAGELLSAWVAALNGGVSLSTMAAAVSPYPTLGEISKRVAGNVLGEKLFSEKVRKTLKFFFNFKGRACGAGSPVDAGEA